MDISKISSVSAEKFTGDAIRSVDRAEDDSFAKKLEAAVKNKDDKALKSACQDFESIMLGIMYKSMKAAVIKSNLFGKDPGMEIFESMQDDALMERASKAGGFGLAEALYRQLSEKSAVGAGNDKNDAAQENGSVFENNEK